MSETQKLDWCIKHDSKANTPLISMGVYKVGMCQQYSLTPSEGQERCEFVDATLTIDGETP